MENEKREIEFHSLSKKFDSKKRAYYFAVEIVKFVRRQKQTDMTFEIISKQLLRSATSIGANIVEAQAGSSKKDFTNFFSYALKSANETKFWLCLLRDCDLVGSSEIKPLLKEVVELSNILGSSIITLKRK